MEKNNNNQELSKGNAIASLTLSILGLILFVMPYIAILFSILAVVFYYLQSKQGSHGFATTGLVLGIIGIFWNLLWLFFVIVLFNAGFV